MTHKFIFIVGVGRSGTSLLQCMLNAHKDIAFLPETHFVRRYLHLEKSSSNIFEDIKNDKDLRKSGLNISKLASDFLTIKEVYEGILKSYGKQKKKSFVGDKDPKNIEYLKTIAHHFPNSFVIHIYRDPRAVIASRKKAKWSEGRSLWADLLAYKAQLAYGRRLGKKTIKNYYEIKYEDLVRKPKFIIEKLLNSLELEYDPNIETYYHAASEIIIGEEISWKKKCLEPVSRDSLERWRSELSIKDVAMIEYVLAPEMKTLGYKAENTGSVTNLWMWMYRCFVQFSSVFYRFRFK